MHMRRSDCTASLSLHGFHMVVTVVKIGHNLSHQPKYNILELKICEAIITREYLYVVYRYKLL